MLKIYLQYKYIKEENVKGVYYLRQTWEGRAQPHREGWGGGTARLRVAEHATAGVGDAVGDKIVYSRVTFVLAIWAEAEQTYIKNKNIIF